MPRPRVFTQMVSKDAKYQPAIRIEFAGKYQSDYFSLRKIAENDFETTQTNLGRLIICDWLRLYRERLKEKGGLPADQMGLDLKTRITRKGMEK